MMVASYLGINNCIATSRAGSLLDLSLVYSYGEKELWLLEFQSQGCGAWLDFFEGAGKMCNRNYTATVSVANTQF